jgi:hypothetical protein
MTITMNDLRQDWLFAKKALVAQLDLMQRDQAFPDISLSQAERERIEDHIRKAINEYEALLEEYPAV